MEMNILGYISCITALSDVLMNNQNRMERIPEFLFSFHQRPIICRSFVGCCEMQPCAQGKAEGRFTASSWQHWMKNTCRFTCGFWKVTGNYEEY